ncbi:MAG: radical SAM protein [Nanobdellota archaeon]
MNIMQKARILGEAGRYDSCGPKECEVKVKNSLGGLYHAESENPNCIMLKTLMSNSCVHDCRYCANSGCSQRKTSYKPEELDRIFYHLKKKRKVNGLFLSSGVGSDPDRTMEEMIDAVRRIRRWFKGYVHLKVLPGTDRDLIKRASALADRMSINIEAPDKLKMHELSSTKDFKTDILRRQSWIKRTGVSQTSQMIINNDSSDKDIMKMARWQYNKMNLSRLYYSSFVPVKGTPMEKERAVSRTRQNRLYNIDFMTRKYGYDFREFNSIMDNGMLPREDPKMALAKKRPKASLDSGYEELLRVPGIGPKTAKRIVEERPARIYGKASAFIRGQQSNLNEF